MADQTYRFYIRQGEFELDLEGDQEFVESYLEAFFEGETAAFPAALPATLAPESKKKSAAQPKSGGSAVDAAALAAFLKTRRPKTNKARILCYLLFLTKSGMNEWGMSQLEACFTAQGQSFPASGRQYFQIFKKGGLVDKGSGWGLWKFTAAGLSAAENPGGNKAAPKAHKAKKAASKKSPALKAKMPAQKKAPAKVAKKVVSKKSPPKTKAAPKQKGARKPGKAAPAAAPVPAPEA